MFPQMKFRVSGLDPSSKYILLLDIVVIFVNNCNKCPHYILCLFVTMILMYTLI